MSQKQKGYLFRRGGWWILRYRETIREGDELKTVQRARRLARCEHKTKKSLQAEVEKILSPIDEHRREPDTVTSLGSLVENAYLPFVKEQKRPSTYRGYRDMWEDHFAVRPALRNSTVWRVRTCDVQGWLQDIAAEDKNPKSGLALSRETLKHLKSFVSGIFNFAKQQGYFDGANPVEGTAVPKAPRGRDTDAYTLDEVNRMLMVVPESAATMIAVASFTGPRRGEISGMTWEGYRDGAIHIERSVWNGHISEPKTKASMAAIPVIPYLAARLERHRERMGNPVAGPIFPSVNGKPVCLNNVLGRKIKPVLNRCQVCRKPAISQRKATTEHAKADHEYKRDDSLPLWHGWHAFRRGLATNLHDLGVDDKTIQAILRHSNVAVTQACYIKTLPEQTLRAMGSLDERFCAQTVLTSKVKTGPTVQ